jgi:hypothetical protein
LNVPDTVGRERVPQEGAARVAVLRAIRFASALAIRAFRIGVAIPARLFARDHARRLRRAGADGRAARFAVKRSLIDVNAAHYAILIVERI